MTAKNMTAAEARRISEQHGLAERKSKAMEKIDADIQLYASAGDNETIWNPPKDLDQELKDHYRSLGYWFSYELDLQIIHW